MPVQYAAQITNSRKMFVKKRHGRPNENVSFDKITSRIERLCYGLDMNFIDPTKIVMKVIEGLYSGVTTCELDNLAAEICAMMSTIHPDYGTLAARIFTSNLHKETKKVFSHVVQDLFNHIHPNTGEHMPLVTEQFASDVMANKDDLNSAIIYDRDYSYSYFGLKTLEKAYLLRINGSVVERPQHLLMRVAVALHGRDLEKVIETYNDMSMRYYIHATPTLFNAGCPRGGLSSCFLLTATAKDDSIENIYKLLGDCAVISKYSGGIGVSIHDIRAKGSLIKSTNGKSEGIIPLLGVFNKSARYVTQSNKRPGSIAVYLEPWHAEIREFIELKENQGADEFRARDLFYGLWIPDLFMKKAEATDVEDQQWCLFCPNEAPGLSDVYGEEFDALYAKYESEGRYREKISARDLLFRICESQIKTGGPYMLYKDAVNRKNNQKHTGTVRGSNLCVAPETRILTSTGYHEIAKLCNKEVAVWNGTQFSKTVVKQTSERSELIKVSFSNGSVLECTDYHKFYIQSPDGVITKDAKELAIADGLIDIQFPVVSGDREASLEHDSVPINADVSTRLRYLEQLHTTAGRSCHVGDAYSLQIDGNMLLLDDVRLMLQTLGTDSILVNNMSGSSLLVPPSQVKALITAGYNPSQWNTTSDMQPVAESSVKVTNVEWTGRQDATYCFNEPLLHKGIFNGVVTGQCCEITTYTDSDQVSVCNIASVGLPSYVKISKGGDPTYDFKLLHDKTKVVAKNLDKVIQYTHYPIQRARDTNLRHRPIGVGVSGLADTFSLMRMPFDSPEARQLNKAIFETIYHAAAEASCELAQELGPYETFAGSEFSKGKFQWNLWEEERGEKIIHSGLWDWDELATKVKQYGMRNSLLTAPMPTASTSQIIGFTEAFEPYNSNIYKRQTLSGEFQVVNKYLLADLCKLGIWNEDVKQKIIANRGSIQGIDEIPTDIQQLYRISWEMSGKTVIDLAADRGPYVDQSQSMNIFMQEPTYKKLTSMHLYGWKKGLKTGMYYLKMKAAAAPLQFTNNRRERNEPPADDISAGSVTRKNSTPAASDDSLLVCTMEEGCQSCSA